MLKLNGFNLNFIIKRQISLSSIQNARPHPEEKFKRPMGHRKATSEPFDRQGMIKNLIFIQFNSN